MARETTEFPAEDNPDVSFHADGSVSVEFGEPEEEESGEENGE